MAKRNALILPAPVSIPEWQRPVIAVPLQQAFPELGEVKEFRSKVCLFNHDRSRIFDVVSPRYQVIPHVDAVKLLVDAMTQYFGTVPHYDVRSFGGGARMVAKFKLPIPPIRMGRHDVTDLLITMRNSYDRGWVFLAVLGAYRQICSNGMMIGEQFGSLNVRHVISAEGQDAQILPQLEYMVQHAPLLRDLWQEWAGTRMTYDEAGELLTGHFPDKYLTPVLEESRFPRSKWDLYNDLTRFSTHDTKSVNRRMEFDEKISKLFYSDVELEGEE